MAAPAPALISLPQSSTHRFPRLQECAHFHYEISTVEFPTNFHFEMIIDDDLTSASLNLIDSSAYNFRKSNANPNRFANTDAELWYKIRVTSNDKRWIIYRTFPHFRYLDKYLHECIFDRRFSYLSDLEAFESCSSQKSIYRYDMDDNTVLGSSLPNYSPKTPHNISRKLDGYLKRLGTILFVNCINCAPILNWFEMDNRGNHLSAIDESPINIPGIGAAVVTKPYVAQGLDELSLDIGNMISLIDMPPKEESAWWRGKKEFQVGYFPHDCVEIIKSGQSSVAAATATTAVAATEAAPTTTAVVATEAAPTPTTTTSSSSLPDESKTTQSGNTSQSARLRHESMISLLRTFFSSRPSRNQLQSKGILKQRVFACDLGEHLSNSQQDAFENIQSQVPQILTICAAFIEKHGIVDGIYRHTGLQSNIQKLRNAFDEDKFSEIEDERYTNDVHAVSSLLKLYFRELPNPLLTYQLYTKFIAIANDLINSLDVEKIIVDLHDLVQQLPPPHFRTLSFLMRHLHQMVKSSPETNMNTKNLAIVWAPNLLKSKEMYTAASIQFDMLHNITLQGNIMEFMIANADTIFREKSSTLVRSSSVSVNKTYRPFTICQNASSSKLISLEEAQDRFKKPAAIEYHTIIDLPDLRKKKQKDNNLNKKSTGSHSIISISAPILVPNKFRVQQTLDYTTRYNVLQQEELAKANNAYKHSRSMCISLPIGIPTGQNSVSPPPSPNPITPDAVDVAVSPPGNSRSFSLLRSLRFGSLRNISSVFLSSSTISPPMPISPTSTRDTTTNETNQVQYMKNVSENVKFNRSHSSRMLPTISSSPISGSPAGPQSIYPPVSFEIHL